MLRTSTATPFPAGWIQSWFRACGGRRSSQEPALGPTGGDRVVADVVLVVDSAVSVSHLDHFMISEVLDTSGNPARLEVIGLPKDYNHGPWGFSPDRLVIELKAVF